MTGCLYIDQRQTLSTCLRIGSWQHGLAVAYWDVAQQDWIEDNTWDIGLTIQQIKLLCSDAYAYQSFINQIPLEIRIAVEPFEHRQIILLQMIHHNSDVFELLQSNPVLVWLLADTIIQKEISISDGCKLVYQKRRDILKFCGGCCSDTAVAVLKKVKAERYTQPLCNELRQIIGNESLLRRLQSLPVLHGSSLHHLSRNSDFGFWLNTRKEYPQDDRIKYSRPETIYYNWWQNVKLMGVSAENINSCKTIASLKKLKNKLVKKLDQKQSHEIVKNYVSEHGTNRLPEFPIRGTLNIEPMNTIEMLAEEAIIMHNCLLSYVSKIVERKCYLLRMMNPERVTIEILVMNDDFSLGQIKTADNGQPQQETIQIIEEWFQSAVHQSAQLEYYGKAKK